MGVFEDASILSSTGGHNSPGSLTPLHTGPATRALRYSSVQNHMTNFLFSSIISWLNALDFQKQKIAIAASSNKSILDIQCFSVSWRPHNSVQKCLL